MAGNCQPQGRTLRLYRVPDAPGGIPTPSVREYSCCAVALACSVFTGAAVGAPPIQSSAELSAAQIDQRVVSSLPALNGESANVVAHLDLTPCQRRSNSGPPLIQLSSKRTSRDRLARCSGLSTRMFSERETYRRRQTPAASAASIKSSVPVRSILRSPSSKAAGIGVAPQIKGCTPTPRQRSHGISPVRERPGHRPPTRPMAPSHGEDSREPSSAARIRPRGIAHAADRPSAAAFGRSICLKRLADAKLAPP